MLDLKRGNRFPVFQKGPTVQMTDVFLLERRRHPRHPIEAQITVLLPEFWQVRDLDDLLGWTNNISEGGVCFSLPCDLPSTELVLHIDYEGMGAEYVLASVVTKQTEADGWRYHCRIDRTLSAIDALSSF